jgi:hypothetical protein
MEHKDTSCPFDTTQYTGTPDAEYVQGCLNVPEYIEEYDSLINRGAEREAADYLAQCIEKAKYVDDWRAELSFLNERLGLSRRLSERESGLDAVERVTEIITNHGMGRTVSGGTIMLNAATTLRCFGETEKSIPIFEQVARIYGDNLSPTDYRFAALYNNMATSYEDIRNMTAAEKHYLYALEILKSCPNSENERAVTLCSLAQLYGKTDQEDSRIEDCLDDAFACLTSKNTPSDAYNAFNIDKCLPVFDYFGFFLYSAKLRERMKCINERT